MNLYNLLPKSFSKKFQASSERTKELVMNVGLSLTMKGATIIASLLLVPMTINYVNPTQYGIWLTLSSIISWIHFFDLGLGSGFRNRFAEAKAKGDTLLAKQLVSTTYFSIGIIVTVICILALLINSFINWSALLKVPYAYQEELQRVFGIVLTFTGINMIANIFKSLLAGDQKTGYSSVITAIEQYISLIVIFILTKYTDGSLTKLALYYSGIPCIVLLVASILLFKTRYKKYKPSFAAIRLNLVRDILQLGFQFFIIFMCLIAIFQVINIVISREVGAIGVTQYNVSNRYFNTMFMIMSIIVTPFWSAFTDAYTKKDFSWMKVMISRMQKCWFVSVFIGLIMLLISPFVYKIWIGSSVNISIGISVAMFFLVICQSFGNIHMSMINGIGTIRLQMFTYIAFAIIAWPLFTLLARNFGLVGVIAFPSFVYFTQGLLAKIQLNKIINHSASGIWLK